MFMFMSLRLPLDGAEFYGECKYNIKRNSLFTAASWPRLPWLHFPCSLTLIVFNLHHAGENCCSSFGISSSSGSGSVEFLMKVTNVKRMALLLLLLRPGLVLFCISPLCHLLFDNFVLLCCCAALHFSHHFRVAFAVNSLQMLCPRRNWHNLWASLEHVS